MIAKTILKLNMGFRKKLLKIYSLTLRFLMVFQKLIMKVKTKTISTLFLIAIMAMFAFSACDKNDQPPIQTGYVNITIYPNSTEYLELNNVGGWVYLYANEPSRGILVYRLSIDEFKAFERTPTYKPDSCCVYGPELKCSRILVDESGIIAVDTCSGSEYLMIDGSVISGPAVYPLVQYQTAFDGDLLHIYN